MSIVTRHMAPHVMASERTGQAADPLQQQMSHAEVKKVHQINNRSICCIDAHSLREDALLPDQSFPEDRSMLLWGCSMSIMPRKALVLKPTR